MVRPVDPRPLLAGCARGSENPDGPLTASTRFRAIVGRSARHVQRVVRRRGLWGPRCPGLSEECLRLGSLAFPDLWWTLQTYRGNVE
jgi:hypothetical protein